MCSAALAFDNNKPLNEWGMIVFNTYEETYSAMLAAAPQPEPNPNWCAGCSPDNCSGCGAEPAAYIFKPNNELLWPHEVDQNVFASDPEDYDLLYTTPQPDRVAELEAALKVAREALANCAADYLHADSVLTDSALAKINEEWQPIETAPKDNTVFLAWRKHATHPLMVRYEPSYDWFANYDGEHVYDLTHWMPLPKPPAIDAAMAKGEK